MVTTASRSRDYLRKQNWTAECVEKKVFNIRRDLFGFADVIAFSQGRGILLVQAYVKGKEKAHEELTPTRNIVILNWIKSGGLFQHHIWSKVGKRGKRKHWEVSVQSF